MLLSLILSAEGSTVKDGTILEGMNDLYPIIIQEYSLESTINDKKESEVITESSKSQSWASSNYEHPDFERAHRLTTLGKKIRVVSGTVAVGSGLIAYAAYSGSTSCKGPDCGSSGIGAFVLASLGGAGYLTGTSLTVLGNYSAHSVLKTKGVEVSNAGIITSGVGLGLGSMMLLDTIYGDGIRDWHVQVGLASICTVPLGFYMQRQINKKAYMRFVDEVSLVPMWKPDSTEIVVHVQL